MLPRFIPIIILVFLAGCATTDTAAPTARPSFAPPAGMSAIRMESGRGSIPLVSASIWIDTVDGKDRRKFDKGGDGFFLIPAGEHEIGLAWASSYLSSFSFIKFEMKPGRTYLAYAKHIPRAIEFWIVDAETGELVDEKHTVSIANKPPIF